MSVYLPGIPLGTDNLSTSQAQMLTNFGELNTQFGIDHTPFNNSGVNGNGFHKKVTLPNQSNGSVPVTTAGFGDAFAWQNADDASLNENTFPYWNHDTGTVNYSMAPIKAAGVFTIATPGGAIVTQQALNCSLARKAGQSQGWYVVTLNTADLTFGLTTGFYYQILVSCFATTGDQNARIINYYNVLDSSFEIIINNSDSTNFSDSNQFNFILIQF
jgi:hypothetical protein